MNQNCYLKIKRIFDILVSLLGLLLLFPFFLILILINYVIMGRPIFFLQERAGQNAVPFKMYKFRSMSGKCSSAGNHEEDAKRLSKWGIFLRKTSLDELPQLLNVLKGDMTFVGPRPLLFEHNQFYQNPDQKKRLKMKPGITGWAQVNGRNKITPQERLAKDLWYIDNASLSLDAIIMLKTIIVVLNRDGS